MNEQKHKVSTNIPRHLLTEATRLSGLNQTSAIIEGLKELIQREKRKRLIELEGKVHIQFEVSRSRERPSRVGAR